MWSTRFGRFARDATGDALVRFGAVGCEMRTHWSRCCERGVLAPVLGSTGNVKICGGLLSCGAKVMVLEEAGE